MDTSTYKQDTKHAADARLKAELAHRGIYTSHKTGNYKQVDQLIFTAPGLSVANVSMQVQKNLAAGCSRVLKILVAMDRSVSLVHSLQASAVVVQR